MCGFQLAGRLWLQRGCLAGRPIQGGHPIHSVVSLLQGLPRRTPEHILGIYIVMVLLVPVGQWRMLTALKWCTKSDNGHCEVQQSCRCSTLAAEFSGLNWMIKLSWTAILCYRRAFFVFFCSTLLRCDLLAKKVPGRAPYSQHIMIRNWT